MKAESALPQPSGHSRLALAVVVLVALAAGLHAFSFLGAGPYDDDYIVHRYARNWIEGRGLVFEAGVRVEGYTVPLWVLLSAVAQLARLDPVATSQWVSILGCALATLFVGLAWLRRFPGALLPVPALILAAAPTLAYNGAAGLGTSALAALLAGWAWLWERAAAAKRGSLGASLCLAAACLLRQECALFVLPYLWSEWRAGRRLAAVPALLCLSGWTAFRLAYYGRWLPMTYAVKKLPPGEDLAYGARYLLQSCWECGLPLFVLLALWGALRGGFRGAVAPARVGHALLAGVSLHLAYVVWVGGDFMPWSRFLMPTLPLSIYLASVATKHGLRAYRASGAVLVLAAMLAPQWLQFGWTAEGRPQRFGEHAFFERRWQLLGEVFRERFPARTRVAISPIGAFGFASGLPLVDILGLTQAGLEGVEPELEVTMKGHHRSDGDWVLAQDPEALVLGNGVLQPPEGRLDINPWERGIVEHPDFARRYGALRMDIPGSGPLVFFLRRDLQLPAGARWL